MRNRGTIYRLFLIAALLFSESASAVIYEATQAQGATWGTRTKSGYASNVGNPTWQNKAEAYNCGYCDAGSGGNAPWSEPDTVDIWFDANPTGTFYERCENKNGIPNGDACETYILKCDPATEIYDVSNHSCQPNTPECQEPGHSIVDFTVGTETTYWCTPTDFGNDEECENPLGTFNDTLICGDKQDECNASGGTYGFVDNQEVCIPNDYDDELPTCSDISSAQLIDGGFVCASPVDAHEDHDIEDSNNHENDIDGDGIPDQDDNDIDGDGIDNSEDGDIDGDGIDNEDDQCPAGDTSCEGGEDSEVDGGGSCSVKPKCTGDAIQCAILYQTWSARCEGEESDTEVSGGNGCQEAPNCSGDSWKCAMLEQQWETRCAGSGIGTAEELDALTAGDTIESITNGPIALNDIVTGAWDQTGPTASCPQPYDITVAGVQLTVNYQPFCDLATTIQPVVLVLFSLVGLRIVMGAF